MPELLNDPAGEKVTSAAEAIRSHVRPGAVLGLGGQNINRCPMALVHEVIRQRLGELNVVGCNLSMPLDQLVAAGLVRRTAQGSGNLERYGVLFTWRRAAERGQLDVADHSHLAMASRFLAGSLGIGFLPLRSLLGTDTLRQLTERGDAVLSEDPWTKRPVVLVRALCPDVSLLHVTRADVDGNVVIDGVTSHEVEMAKASRVTIVSTEELVPRGVLAADPERVTLSSAYVGAVVEEPFGAFPTAVYQRYDYSDTLISEYQRRARAEGAEQYLDEYVHAVADFAGHLALADPEREIRNSLEHSMRSLS